MASNISKKIKKLRYVLMVVVLFSLIGLGNWRLAVLVGLLAMWLPELARLPAIRRVLNPEPVRAQRRSVPAQDDGLVELSEAEINAFLVQEAQPAIYLKRHWPMQPVSDANSYLGGLPKLPDGTDWPENPQTGLALHHLAQIDLADMPRIDVDPNLPLTGMLWFFADINEEMDWSHGPSSPESCVLYAPVSTKDAPMRSAPENLPQVDHRARELSSNLWAFRGPRRTVYPRWPLTGHAAQTWPLEEVPAGVSRRSNYLDARASHMEKVQQALQGEKPEPVTVEGQIIATTRQRAEDDMGKATVVTETHYRPDALGDRFPYIAAMAVDVLAALGHAVGAQLESDEGHLRYRKATDRGPDRDVTDRLPGFRQAVEDIKALSARIDALPPDAPLGAADLQLFDDMIRNYACDTLFRVRGSGVIDRGWTCFFHRSINDPALRAKVPALKMQQLSAGHAPANSAAAHYLMGAKGMSSNETAGHGVRLAQFDSDYGMDFMFCDCGIIDFWIDAHDLANGRWDRAWAATAGG